PASFRMTAELVGPKTRSVEKDHRLFILDRALNERGVNVGASPMPYHLGQELARLVTKLDPDHDPEIRRVIASLDMVFFYEQPASRLKDQLGDLLSVLYGPYANERRQLLSWLPRFQTITEQDHAKLGQGYREERLKS